MPQRREDQDTILRDMQRDIARLKNAQATIDQVRLEEVAVRPPTPSSGGVLYVEGGALKYLGPLGTVTTIAPA